jgi:hypothetical protein
VVPFQIIPAWGNCNQRRIASLAASHDTNINAKSTGNQVRNAAASSIENGVR